jgi:hypothetical protein
MKALALTAVMAVSVVLLAGCTAPSAHPPTPLPSGPAVVDSRTPGPRAAKLGPAPTPAVSLSAHDTIGLESTPWEFVRATGTTLTIRYVAGGGCSAWRGVRVAQAAKSVELWTTVQTDHGQQACADYLATGSATIQLTRPLGSRRLLHAPVSKTWKIYESNF